MKKIKDVFMILGCIFAFNFYILFLIGILFNAVPYEHSMLNLIVAILLTIIIKMDLKDDK